jgi:F-type H+-transporting ATPase subunit b
MFTRRISALATGLCAAWLLAAPPLAGGAAAANPSPAAHGEHASSASGDETPNPLAWKEFKADLAIWTAVVFLVLLVVLWLGGWGRLAQGLDRREEAIAGQIAQAEEANRQAKELLARYEQKLADAKQEVRALLEEARRHADERGREMLDQARQEAEAEHQRALREIDKATAGALKELAQRSATLAVELAGKILQANLTPQDHQHLIEQAVANFARQGPSNN